MNLLLERVNQTFRAACKTKGQFSGLTVAIEHTSATTGSLIARWSFVDDLLRIISRIKPSSIMFEGHKPQVKLLDRIKQSFPDLKVYVRIHSNIPFLTVERGFFEHLELYRQRGVTVAYNDDRAFHALKGFAPSVYLPNIYLLKEMKPRPPKDKDIINIGCFGSIRPLKNQIVQLLAAIEVAESLGKKLQMHMNLGRCEGGQKEILILHSIMKSQSKRGHRLVSVPWMGHGAFLEYLNQNIDIGMQVSLTESFNIVAADYTAAGIPMVVSDEVRWAPGQCKAPTGCPVSIAEKAIEILSSHEIVSCQRESLSEFSSKSKKLWREANL